MKFKENKSFIINKIKMMQFPKDQEKEHLIFDDRQGQNHNWENAGL